MNAQPRTALAVVVVPYAAEEKVGPQMTCCSTGGELSSCDIMDVAKPLIGALETRHGLSPLNGDVSQVLRIGPILPGKNPLSHR
jgi:hypothetical protein